MKNDDVINLLRENKKLSRKFNKVNNLMNILQDAVIVVDNRGIIDFANEASKKLLSLPEQLESVSLFKLLPDLTISDAKPIDSIECKEFYINYPEKRFIKAYIVQMENPDALENNYTIILRDATKEKISTDLTIENEKFNSLLNLASGIAHELGNPLNSMSIHLQLITRLLEKIGDEKTKSAMQKSTNICTSEIKRLDAIIKNFLSALRPMNPVLSTCDIIKPLAETLQVLEVQLADIPIEVEVNIPNTLPTVRADSTLLKQLFFNIVKNAMEATKTAGSLTITASSSDDFVNISFADTGCGINPNDLTKVFDPYYTTKETGSGLGMMIVESIIRSHKGKISIDSNPGKGTTISISIPRSHPAIKRIE